jgi:hypothetical protein
MYTHIGSGLQVELRDPADSGACGGGDVMFWCRAGFYVAHGLGIIRDDDDPRHLLHCNLPVGIRDSALSYYYFSFFFFFFFFWD